MNKLEETIKSILTELSVRRRHVKPAINSETLVFEELGLDSFAFAELVLVLEQETGLDPFTQAEHVIPVRTVSDIVSVYTDEAKRRNIN
jgi:acyl carrier protein